MDDYVVFSVLVVAAAVVGLSLLRCKREESKWGKLIQCFSLLFRTVLKAINKQSKLLKTDKRFPFFSNFVRGSLKQRIPDHDFDGIFEWDLEFGGG